MSYFRLLHSTFCIAVMSGLLNGCASLSDIPADGTVLLLEAPYVLTRNQILDGDLGPDNQNPNLYKQLLSRGWKDEDLTDGRVVATRFYYYWHNVASGIIHEALIAAPVSKGISVTPGNIVGVEIQGGRGTVVSIVYKDLKAGSCTYRKAARGALAILDAVSLVGGPGRAYLDCPGLEHEGWTKVNNLWQRTSWKDTK